MDYQNIFKRQSFMIALAIIMIGVIVIGASYALFIEDVTSENQTISSGSLSATFTEGTTINNIVIPLHEFEAELDESNVYNYSITNNGTINMDYKITLQNNLTDTSNMLDLKYIKVKINNGTATYLQNTPLLVANAPVATAEYIIHEGTLAPAETLSNQSIKLWISLIDKNGEEIPPTISGQDLNLKINIHGEVE